MKTVVCLTTLLLATVAYAQDAPIDSKIQASLKKHCVICHGMGSEKPKGNFRVNQLTANFDDSANREAWQTVLARVQAGEMPPKKQQQLDQNEKQTLETWIQGGFKTADAKRRAEGRVVLRRLNRIEYENTMRDLFGLPIELQEILPQDGSANGFDNVGEALHVSSFLMEKYLEGAEKALNNAIANLPQPPLIKKRYSLKDSHNFKSTTEKVYRKLDDDTIVCFSSSHWNAVHLSPFYPPDRGKYHFRIQSSGFQSADKPVVYRVDAGKLLMGSKNHLVGYFDAPADKPTILEFDEHLENRSTLRIQPYGLANSDKVNKIGADKYDGPGLALHYVEVEGPLYDRWPPESHRRIFGDLAQIPAPIYNYSNRVEVSSRNPEADAEKILRSFSRRAFRRNVTDEDLQPFIKLVKDRLADKYSFEKAVRVGLMGMLVSKDFLFLQEKPGKLDDFALASRLSYFLWSSMPDEALLDLAENKKLSEPKTLRDQVERMLKDPKASAFTENFVGQWLGLREIDATEPSHILYPEYDHMLKMSMLRETYLFFEELLKDDLSLSNFIDSDFSMLNGRLAKHYGIPGIEGWEFHKTKLPKDCHRGGVLTMASVLKVTANGTYTSPVLRGAWVMERILGTPPPRPPENVSAVEPDIRGATTIREQLAKHRSVESCAACHVKIDPPGFALESFDVIGGWRDYYRTSGNGKPVLIEGRRMPYLQGKKVDPADVMPDGRKFRDIDEFKKLLFEQKDQVAKALTERLVTYATGATCQPGDRPEIEAIVNRIRERNFGLRSLIHEIVQSDLFLRK